MERRRSPGAGAKVKKKMTKEQVQLAIIKKRECDARALKIVESMLEPKIEPEWLMQNLKHINRCHMEDVIEERAITRVCGYVLCQKSITAAKNQRYHISLRDKKVYDITKSKNFCSSSCFGASNYLLEQMLTSPLWLRDKEEIPQFEIFSKEILKKATNTVEQSGDEIDIALYERCKEDDTEIKEESVSNVNNGSDKNTTDEVESTGKVTSGCIENFVIEAIKTMNNDEISVQNSNKSNEPNTSKTTNQCGAEDSINNTRSTEKSKANSETVRDEHKFSDVISKTENNCNSISEKQGFAIHSHTQCETKTETQHDLNSESKPKDGDTIHQCIYPVKKVKNQIENDFKISAEKTDEDTIEQCIYPIEEIMNKDKNDSRSEMIIKSDTDGRTVVEQSVYSIEKVINRVDLNLVDPDSNLKTIDSKNGTSAPLNKMRSDENKNIKKLKTENEVSAEQRTEKTQVSKITSDNKNKKSDKKLRNEKRKQAEPRVHIDTNLAAKVEQSFYEWVTEGTIHFLFGDDSVKQTAIERIEKQDRYSLLCEKLNRLQFQDEQEDDEVLEKQTLKPAPHFAVLQEEGKKLDVKVRAFFQGKTTFEEPDKPVEKHDPESQTFIPLTDAHAPQSLRRKIFLDRLDQVLPDLLRTLAGNNEVYARGCCNYTSVRCSAVRALIQTFSLSAKNIMFKPAEWTLIGLVIIKMLSLLDPWLAQLLLMKQANMYISMILTSYKLDPNYLNLFVTSFNPNMNSR